MVIFLLLALATALFDRKTVRAETSSWFSAIDAMTVNLEGRREPEVVLVARVGIGSLNTPARLVVDFRSRELRLASTAIATASSSFMRIGEKMSDVVHISGHVQRMPVIFDIGAAMARLGCPTCDGVLGAGARSVLWLRWPQVTLTTGLLWLGGRDDFDNYPRLDCGFGGEEICVAPARVEGFEGVEVRFAPTGPLTMLPRRVFGHFTRGLRIEDNSSPADWPNLVLEFVSTEGKRFNLTIPDNDLVVRPTGAFQSVLMVREWDEDYIRLGFSAWQSFQAHLDVNAHTMGLREWGSALDYQIVSLLLMLFIIPMLIFWKMTPTPRTLYEVNEMNASFLGTLPTTASFMFSAPAQRAPPKSVTSNPEHVGRHTLEWKRFENSLRFVVEMVAIGAAGVVYASPGTREILRGEPVLDLFLGLALALLVIFFVAFQWAFWTSEWIDGKGLRASHPSLFFPESLMTRRRGGRIDERIARHPTASRASFARVSWMRSYTIETLVLITSVILLSETRADTLGGTLATLVAMIAIGNSYYATAVSVVLALHGGFSWAWALFIVLQALLTLGFLTFFSQSFFYPFLLHIYNIRGSILVAFEIAGVLFVLLVAQLVVWSTAKPILRYIYHRKKKSTARS